MHLFFCSNIECYLFFSYILVIFILLEFVFISFVQPVVKALNIEKEVLKFEQNIGQFPETQLLYRATDIQATYFFTRNEIRSVVSSAKDSMQTAYALRFVGANEAVQVNALHKHVARHGIRNYITSQGSYSDVPYYTDLEYKGLWHGVDALFYESREGKGTMKYDFVVQPNTDPSVVRLKMDGVKDIKINDKGELEFTTPFGTLQKGKPYTYQVIDGKKVEISSAYTLDEEGEIGFKIGHYDPSVSLVIDPIALKWSTCLGGANTDVPKAFYLHPTTGNIYITGYTDGASYPKTFGATYAGDEDGFISCLSADGSTLLWSTYIGGSSYDELTGIKLDAAGDIYLVGISASSDFPIQGTISGYDMSYNPNGGWPGSSDVIVLRLNSTATVLKYGTFLGGANSDVINYTMDFLVDNGVVFAAAEGNPEFPVTPNAWQTTNSSGGSVPVWFRLNTNVAGTLGLEYSTFFSDIYGRITAIKEDKDGNLWLAGASDGIDPTFPTSPNAIIKTAEIIDNNWGGIISFAAKFTKTGQYLYSTLTNPCYSEGGIANDAGFPSLTIDDDGNAYLASASWLYSGSNNEIVPLSNILEYNQLVPSAQMNSSGQIKFTYIVKIPYDLSPQFNSVTVIPSEANGGSENLSPSIAFDKNKNLHLTLRARGIEGSPLIATSGALNTTIDASLKGAYYVLSPDLKSVKYGTFYNINDFSSSRLGIAVNDKCEAYILSAMGNRSITTPSYHNYDTNAQVNVFDPTPNGSNDVGIMVFHEPEVTQNSIPNFVSGNNTFCVGGAIWQNPNDGPILGTPIPYISGDGSSATHNLPNISVGGTLQAHPTPASPAIGYVWQKRLNGGTWTNVPNGNLTAFKPSPESVSGSIEYRRLAIGVCKDTLSVSNTINATISGTFNLNITTPPSVVYYCPGTTGTSLGINVTGASGNISWQWYDGFAPLSGNGIISPSSGSGVPASSFTAEVGVSANSTGFYRLVITDAGGCRKEAFVSIAPKVTDAGTAPSIQLCPGGITSVTIGPNAINPDFQYQWTGPSGYTSNIANPTVTVAGVYNLQVKIASDAGYCAPGTSITILAATAHDASLTSLPDKAFCQVDNPAGIGLSGTAPLGYVFQWVPATNLDNAQAYNPKFDPGSIQGGFPIGTINYTFTALRLADGCIYEDQITVTDTARALAKAGNDVFVCASNEAIVGEPHGANYFQWRAISTTFPGGMAALTSNPAFKMNGSSTNSANTMFLTAGIPSHSACYEIDYEITSSWVPFPVTCATSDTVRVRYCPTCGTGTWCPDVTSNTSGTDGACGGTTTTIGTSATTGVTYLWETQSVNGVVQSGINRLPRGLFTTTGYTPISGTSSDPSTVIANFDDPSWGWTGANVVIYRIIATANFGTGTVTCYDDVQVFSAADALPVIGVLDQALCAIPSPGVRLGSSGQSAPYTVNGGDYTQAPNSAFIWSWSGNNITAGTNTAFPTINPTVNSRYIVTVRDPQTGCSAKDTMDVFVTQVIANAGADLTNICPGSLVQIGTPSNNNHTYSWSPATGLNFPIGTPNSTVAQPYLLVPSSPTPPTTLTYTVTVTETTTGCQATETINISTTNTAPPAISPATYEVCDGASLTIGPSGSLVGATYLWTLQSGAGNLSWLSSTTVRQPVVTIPSGFVGPVVFRLTVTKGTCGSVFADYTLNGLPALTLGGPYTSTCTSGVLIGNATSGYTYQWTPWTGLYLQAAATSPYTGNQYWAQLYAKPLTTTIYTFTRTNSIGCTQSATVTVNPAVNFNLSAGNDVSYCLNSGSITIGQSGTGTLSWSAAVGYSASTIGSAPTTIASPMTSAQMLGYIGGSANSPTRSFPSGTPLSGTYVYRLTATDGTCTSSDDVVITVPSTGVNVAGLSQNVCLGESVQLGIANAPIGSYTWSVLSPLGSTGGIDNSNISRPNVTPTANTVYQVVYTEPTTGCSTTNTVTVNITPKPNITDVSMPSVCAPASAVDLTAQISGYGSLVNSLWYANSYPGGVAVNTPTSVAPTATTTYYIVAENTYGCKDTAQITANISNPQTPTIAPSVNVPCSTTSLDLANYQGAPSQAGYTLEWHNANNTNAGSLLSSTVITTQGTYYLFEKAPSPSNCYSASDNIIIVFASPNTPSVSNPQTNVCPVTTVNLNTVISSLTPSVSGGVFEWHTTNSSTSPAVGTPTAATAGTYYLFEKAPNGCYSTAYAVQVQIQTCCPTSVCIPITITRAN